MKTIAQHPEMMPWLLWEIQRQVFPFSVVVLTFAGIPPSLCNAIIYIYVEALMRCITALAFEC